MGIDLKPEKERLKEESKIRWDRRVAVATLIGIVVQVITVVFFVVTVFDAKRSTEILSQTLQEYRHSNSLTERMLTASHLPMLTLRIIKVEKDQQFHTVRITFSATNTGDSFANHLLGSFDINDDFGREISLTDPPPKGYSDYTSTEYDSPITTGLVPLKFITCILPKEERVFEANISDAPDWRVYSNLMNGNATFMAKFTFEDMFVRPYGVTVRFRCFKDVFYIRDMELTGYSDYLPSGKASE